MELRRCTRGTGMLAILLVAGSVILDDPVVFFAGSTIIAGLVVAYLRFDRLSQDIVRSVTVTRSLERTRIRKGATLRVTTDISLDAPSRVSVEASELIPEGVVVQDGETGIRLNGAGSGAGHRLRYRITPLVHGTLPVRGISLTIRDIFFQAAFSLTADRFSGPLLFVQPRGAFEPGQRHSVMETREIEKMSVLSGFGIRSLREYFAGDNIRDIDWKLSAKHDKIFIREYTGMVNLPPVIVVDLPWSGLPFPAEEFDRMVEAVAGLVEQSVRNYQYFTLILVSGPNIMQVIENEKDIRQGMAALREWLHPAERVVHWYRVPDRSGLREEARRLEEFTVNGTGAHNAEFFSRLKKRYHAILPSQRPTAFSTDLVRVLLPIATDEMVVFSLCTGDVSHLREIIRQAKIMKFDVRLRIPAASTARKNISAAGRIGADRVEAFA